MSVRLRCWKSYKQVLFGFQRTTKVTDSGTKQTINGHAAEQWHTSGELHRGECQNHCSCAFYPGQLRRDVNWRKPLLAGELSPLVTLYKPLPDFRRITHQHVPALTPRAAPVCSSCATRFALEFPVLCSGRSATIDFVCTELAITEQWLLCARNIQLKPHSPALYSLLILFNLPLHPTKLNINTYYNTTFNYISIIQQQ